MKIDSIYTYTRRNELEHRARVEWGLMSDAERTEFQNDRSGTKTKEDNHGKANKNSN